MYGLLGVNGAGKTTTMKMLTTLIMPTSGEAELLGHSIKTDRAAVKQIIGISPQESAAAMNLTARENLELMAEVYGFSKKVAKAKASELIERFSMREFENRKAKKLSGGEVRRLSIAMALISEPKILFLDEPTLGLEVSVNILLMLAVNIPIAIVFISLGLLLGTLLNEKAVGGICGALLTNLSAWFSNIWFDTAMVGGWFKNLANALPFAHAVNAARDAISGNYSDIMPELIPVCGYAVVLLVLAVVVFSVMIKRNK